MIESRQDLKEYLEADRIALKRKGHSPSFHDLIWKYEIALRKSEYYQNTTKGIQTLKTILGASGNIENGK